MTRQLELDDSVIARGDTLSPAQLGLLLADLQLSAETAASPERFRRALALLARPAGTRCNGVSTQQTWVALTG